MFIGVLFVLLETLNHAQLRPPSRPVAGVMVPCVVAGPQHWRPA